MNRLYTLTALLVLLPALASCRDVNIIRTGAREGGRDNAAAIQKAIDRVSRSGGGTVTVPAGEFYTGPIEMKSGVELHLEEGARLLGVADIAAYTKSRIAVDRRNSPVCALVYAKGQENIALTGPGTIDGQGGDPAFRVDGDPGGRPMIILFRDCTNVTVKDLHLENSAHWVEYYYGCEHVRISGVKVRSHCNYNNDGIDIDSRDVVVSDCIFDCEDDAICLKSLSDKFCENVTVTDCVAASNCNAVKLGTDSYYGFRNITVSGVEIHRASEDNFRHWAQTLKGITAPVTVISGIAIELVDGGVCENVSVSNVTMKDVQTPIFIRMARRNESILPGGSRMSGITISGVRAVSESLMTSSVTGVPGLYPENISISDIEITSPGGGTAEMVDIVVPEAERRYPENRCLGFVLPASGFYIRHTRNVHLSNVNFLFRSPDERPLVVTDDCENFVED